MKPRQRRLIEVTQTNLLVNWKTNKTTLLTPDNSNPRANSNPNRFRLDFLHKFTVILPSITRTMFYSAWKAEKKKVYRSPKHSEFISLKPSHPYVLTFMSLQLKMQCPSVYINQALLPNSFIQNINLCLLLPSPSICLIFSYFRLFASNSR